MTEKRTIIGHARHSLQGPHAEFVPLRLCIEAEHLHFDVVCPAAIVGRHSDADLRLSFPDVSRRHCRLAFEDGQWRIYDMKSMNGIFVNNVRTLQATLYAGDLLRVGGVKLLVEAATPLRLSKAEEEKHEKLRQIVEVLPAVNE